MGRLPAVPATHPRQAACRAERAETASARNGARQKNGSPGTSYPGVPSAYERTNSAPVRRSVAGPRRFNGPGPGLPRRGPGGTAPVPSCAYGAPARRRPRGRTPRGGGCRGGRRRKRAPPDPPSIPRSPKGRWARKRRCPPPRSSRAPGCRPSPERRGRSWRGPGREIPGSSARSRRPRPRGPARRPRSPTGARAPRGHTTSTAVPETGRDEDPAGRSPDSATPADWQLLRRGRPRSCPPFFLHRGYPWERIPYGSGVRLPVGASSVRPLAVCRVVHAAVGDGGEDLADRSADGVQIPQCEVALVQLAVEVDPVDDPGDGLVHLLRPGAVQTPH